MGHEDTSTQIDFPVEVGSVWLTATVSGSWKCWGTADQTTDGDDTLHVQVDITEQVSGSGYGPPGFFVDLFAALEWRTQSSHLLDFAVLTDRDDHSLVLGVLLRAGGRVDFIRN